MLRKNVREFGAFIGRPDLVTAATGLILALTVKGVIEQIVAAVLNPLVALVFGQPDFSAIGFDVAGTRFPIGLVVNALFVFVSTAFVLFFVLKAWSSANARIAKPAEATAEHELLGVLNEISAKLDRLPAVEQD
jgi:large conductance mechanosensitive channel